MRHINSNLIIGSIAALVVVATVAVAGCGQPPVTCTVSTFTGYAAKYELVSGDGACAERAGDVIGLANFNPATKDAYDNIVPNLNEVSLAIRTETLGGLVAAARDSGVEDTTDGHKPHAFGPFTSARPVDDICHAEVDEVRQDLDAFVGINEDPEDPDEDVPAGDAVAMGESWEDVQVFVNAANLGTQMKGRYTVTDDVEGCTATYDVLAVYPAVFCEDIVPDGDPVDIASVDDDNVIVETDSDADGDEVADSIEVRTLTVHTDGAHGLAEGDAIEIADVDDDDGFVTFNGTYTVLAVVDPETFTTEEVDPLGEDDAARGDDAVSGRGTVQKLQSVGNEDYCNAVAQPEKGIAVGSGISPDFPVVCDPELLMCVLNASPTNDPFPVLNQ